MVPVGGRNVGVPVHGIDVVVGAGQQRGAAGRAKAVGDEGIGEAQAFLGDAIDVRRIDQPAAIATESRLGHAFAGDPQDIGALGQRTGVRSVRCRGGAAGTGRAAAGEAAAAEAAMIPPMPLSSIAPRNTVPCDFARTAAGAMSCSPLNTKNDLNRLARGPAGVLAAPEFCLGLPARLCDTGWVMPIEDLQAAAQKIAGFLNSLNKLGGLRLKFRITAGAGAADPDGMEAREIYVELAGPDVPLVIQHNGELLRALETIAAQMLRLESRESDLVSFDAANFKALRAQELRLAAETAAEKVRRTGVPYSFPPMNSRERRLLHMACRGLEGVETASQRRRPGPLPGGVSPGQDGHPSEAAAVPPRGFGRR